jgi:hypothetical protein
MGNFTSLEMCFWSNVIWVKLSFYANVFGAVSFWSIVFLGKFPTVFCLLSSWQMSFWPNVKLGKCLSGQMSFWANVFLSKCLYGQMSPRQMSSRQMSSWANVAWANILLGKCRMGKCLWSNVVWANVIEPSLSTPSNVEPIPLCLIYSEHTWTHAHTQT